MEIVRASRDVSAVMGTGIVSETRRFTDAIASGYVQLKVYGFRLNAVTAAELEQARIGGATELMRIILANLHHNFGGKYEILNGSWSAYKENCNANSKQNVEQFSAVLKNLHSKLANAAAEAQQAVVNLCEAGKSEREAFDYILAILRGH